MKKKPVFQYVVCINNEGYNASLDVGKLYRVVAAADEHDMLRVVDNSGEDYLFEAACFFPLELPPALVRELRRAY